MSLKAFEADILDAIVSNKPIKPRDLPSWSINPHKQMLLIDSDHIVHQVDFVKEELHEYKLAANLHFDFPVEVLKNERNIIAVIAYGIYWPLKTPMVPLPLVKQAFTISFD